MKSFILAVAVLMAAQASAETLGDQLEREQKFAVECKNTGRNSLQCIAHNNTSRDAEYCADVVKVCKDGDHVATLCTGVMRSGETTSKVVHDFQPKIKFFAGCMGIEFRNRSIR